MTLLNKLPGYKTVKPGLERAVLRRLPPALAIGLAVLVAPSVLLRVLPWDMHAMKLDSLIAKTDIYAAGCIWAYCNLLLLITFAAIIVALMKGPAYVADAYPLLDAERPRPLSMSERAHASGEPPDCRESPAKIEPWQCSEGRSN